MSSPSPSSRPRRAARAPRLALQLSIALVAVLLLELLLRGAGYGPADAELDPLVGFDGGRPLLVAADAGGWITAPYKRNHFNVQTLSAEKAPGTTRIVCLGGSTTYGRPYTDATSFPGWLRALLPEADPTRRWEVFNAGGISYASYRVTAVLEELLGHDPDVVILYTGHNEFLEERSFGALKDRSQVALGLSSALRNTALFRWASRLVTPGPAAHEATDASDLLPGEVATLLDGSLGLDAFSRDAGLAADVLAQYEHNLERMAALCARADVPLVLVTPASELADCRPFKSQWRDDLPPERRAAVQALLDADTPDLAALEAAVDDDTRHALAWYRLAQAREAAGDTAGARQAYLRARDEDVVPLRAVSPIVESARGVAGRLGLPLVDWVARVDTLAAERRGVPIPGRELFLDHVHMTIEAYRLLALELIDTLAGLGLAAPRDGWDPAGVTEQVLAAIDPADHARALVRLANVLDWAGKREEARALTEQALALSGGGDAMGLWNRGNFLRDDGDLDGALEAYREAVSLDPGYAEAWLNLGELLLTRGELDGAAESFEQVLELDDAQAEAHFGLGVILDRRQQRAESRNALRRAIKLAPGHANALNLMGVSWLKDGRTEEAEGFLEAATLADPGLARAHYNLALLYSATGRLDQAVLEYEAALEIDPGNARTWNKLGMARASLGEMGGALAALLRATELAPDDDGFAQDYERARTRAKFQGLGG